MNIKTNMYNIIAYVKGLSLWKKIALGVLACLVLGCMLLLVLRIMVSFEVLDDLPSKKELTTIANPIASELYADNGELLGRYYTENRSKLELTDLNEFYKNALIATEDRRFYKHGGVDRRSLFRVFFKTILLQKDASGGGSTITQQLAKNLYPRKRFKVLGTLINKFREMEIAQRIEDVYNKEEILLLYSNTVSFGERAFGLNTAAHRFFNKKPEDLLLEEAAVLVGMLKATSFYSPRNYPDRARNRRNVVLGQMAKYDYITVATADQLSKLPLTLDYQPPSDVDEKARYFKEFIKKEFRKWSISESKPDGSKYDIYKDGLKIYTTLNTELQDKAEQIVKQHMSRLQSVFLDSWKGGRLYGSGTKLIDEKITSDPFYKNLRAQGMNGKEALSYFTTHADRELWSWKGMDVKSATKIDSIKHYLSLLHTGLLAVNPATGGIKAWVGGNDYRRFQYDNITGPRQVGSTFKPIVYLAALESGKEPCDTYDNELITYKEYENWTPKNSSGKYGGQATMKGALTHSLNTISVQLLFETGLPTVVDMATKLGVVSTLNKVPSLVLGTSDVSLLEMVNVYSTFANRGVRKTIKGIQRIEDGQGNVLYELENTESSGERVVSQKSVDALNEMLQNVTVKGTAKRIYQQYDIRFPVMGKTGTTQNQSDGWFLGFNDDLVIGSWVGTMDRRIHFRNLGTGSGGRTALPMVASLFEYADDRGMIKHRKGRISEITECVDTISSLENRLNLKEKIEKEMDQLARNILGKYYNKPRRSSSDKNKRRKRDKERDKKYREYKKAIRELEKKLEELDS